MYVIKKMASGFQPGGKSTWIFVSCFIYVSFCIHFVGPLCALVFHWGRMQHITEEISIGGWVNLWGMSGGGVGSDTIILQSCREWGASDQINNCAQNNCNESMQWLLSIGFRWQREEPLSIVWSPIGGNFFCTSCYLKGGHCDVIYWAGLHTSYLVQSMMSVQWFFSFNGAITDETSVSFFMPHIIFSLNY